MPHFLLSIYHTDASPMGEGATSEEIFRDVAEFNRSLEEQGAWVYAGGLMPAGETVVVDAIHGDGAETVSGTVLPGELQLGGMWIINAADMAAARAWGMRASAACRFPVEVRAFHDE